jgi:hypothetical protein
VRDVVTARVQFLFGIAQHDIHRNFIDGNDV